MSDPRPLQIAEVVGVAKIIRPLVPNERASFDNEAVVFSAVLRISDNCSGFHTGVRLRRPEALPSNHVSGGGTVRMKANVPITAPRVPIARPELMRIRWC